MAELQKLQQARQAREAAALDQAARQYLLARNDNQSFDPNANGFEFSIAEIERYISRRSPGWVTQVTAQVTPGHQGSYAKAA